MGLEGRLRRKGGGKASREQEVGTGLRDQRVGSKADPVAIALSQLDVPFMSSAESPALGLSWVPRARDHVSLSLRDQEQVGPMLALRASDG